jgi:hypothetical protein
MKLFRRVVPYGQGLHLEPLVSRKVATREGRTEGSDTAKLGTDEQKPHMRLNSMGKQAHLCNAQKNTKSTFK